MPHERLSTRVVIDNKAPQAAQMATIYNTLS
jgi:hypothetical protein